MEKPRATRNIIPIVIAIAFTLGSAIWVGALYFRKGADEQKDPAQTSATAQRDGSDAPKPQSQ